MRSAALLLSNPKHSGRLLATTWKTYAFYANFSKMNVNTNKCAK